MTNRNFAFVKPHKGAVQESAEGIRSKFFGGVEYLYAGSYKRVVDAEALVKLLRSLEVPARASVGQFAGSITVWYKRQVR